MSQAVLTTMPCCLWHSPVEGKEGEVQEQSTLCACLRRRPCVDVHTWYASVHVRGRLRVQICFCPWLLPASLHLLCAHVCIRELAAGVVGVSSAHRHWYVRLHVPMHTEGFVSVALCV